VGEPGSGEDPALIVVAHANTDDLTAVLAVATVALVIAAVGRARRRRPWRAWLAVAAVSALATLAVSRVQPTLPTPAKVRPASTAQLTITSPHDGDVTGRSVVVRLRLAGGHLVAATSTNLAPDQGHIHLIVDGRVITSVASLTVHIHVAAGRHVVQAEYVALDHGPFSPRVLAVVTFSAR